MLHELQGFLQSVEPAFFVHIVIRGEFLAVFIGAQSFPQPILQHHGFCEGILVEGGYNGVLTFFLVNGG